MYTVAECIRLHILGHRQPFLGRELAQMHFCFEVETYVPSSTCVINIYNIVWLKHQ